MQHRPGAADGAFITWGYVNNGGTCTRSPGTLAQNGSCGLPTVPAGSRASSAESMS